MRSADPENSRRIERERVIALLYEAEIKGQSAEEVLGDLPVPPERFVVDMVVGVSSDAPALDETIDKYVIDWKSDRLAVVDRAILRAGIWELDQRPETPVAVIISEAVELAKRFSTEESGKFVNGVLDAIATDLRKTHSAGE